MSIDLDDVSQELLTFGMDVWPESAFGVYPPAANDDEVQRDGRIISLTKWCGRLLTMLGIYLGSVAMGSMFPNIPDFAAEASTRCAVSTDVGCSVSPFAGRHWQQWR